LDVLERARYEHEKNRSEIDYLWRYYKGEQPILRRTKTIRPEINNRIVENRANEIVSFKVGYLVGEPIQYVGRTNKKATIASITKLNNMMTCETKSSRDQEIVEWGMVCGTAYRIVLPKRPLFDGDAPFKIRTLDPRDTMVVYSSGVDEEALLAAKYARDEDDREVATVYTDTYIFEISEREIKEIRENPLGHIPIIEYRANNARLGAFEVVLPLLDALNNVDSNRIDGIEQFVQAFVKFVNCDISTEEFTELMHLGGLKLKSVDGLPADADIVSSELNQTQTQTLKDDLYSAVLTIVGMPNRNGGSSTSDTGQAVYMRDGYAAAETSAKSSENMFRASEIQTLNIVLKICETDGVLKLSPSDIETKFTRRNYDAIQSKAQTLTTMLGTDKIHPLLAFTHCGMFSDPEGAYALSEEYKKSIATTTEQGRSLKNAQGEENTDTKTENFGEGTPKNANKE
jgi:SPP1 family phage portal protein